MKTVIKLYMLPTILILASCGKEFLDVKREAHQVVPSTIEDYQAILNNNSIMNVSSLGLGMIGGGEFYVSEEILATITRPNLWQRNAYLWLSDTFDNDEARDWNNPYERILYANLALDVERITPVTFEQTAWETAKGQALFHRAWNYFQLAQTFCDYYQKNSGQEQPGLPMRLEYDVSTLVPRYTLQETFEQILKDLENAVEILPEITPHQFQPSKAAGYALLARIRLYLGDYEQASNAADIALRHWAELLDFNTLDSNLRYTFSEFTNGDNNPEVIFYCHNTAPTIMTNSRMHVDSNLYKLYDNNDLRWPMYFGVEPDGRIQFKGSYTGSGAYFTGLATDELYLIKSECAARQGNLHSAQTYLNTLLERRYFEGNFTFLDFSNMDQLQVLETVLKERQKELYMRGVRWGDLKRLNSEDQFVTSLERFFDGQRYELTPTSSGWAYPIPDNEVRLGGW